MKLRHIIMQIVEYTASDLTLGQLPAERVLLKLDILSEHNLDLRNPLNEDPNVYYFRERAAPLTGDEPLAGAYFAFTHIGHVPEMYLVEFQTQEALEQHLLSDSGLFNPFTTHLIAFVHGQLKAYRLFYKNPWRREREFVKAAQYGADDEFTKKYQRRKLQWID